MTWTADFDNADYVAVATAEHTTTSYIVSIDTPNVGTCQINIQSNDGTATDVDWAIVAFGNQV